MAEESKATERFSLSRWSRRKLEAARADPPAPDVASAPPAAVPASSSPAVAPVPTPVTAPAESERPQVETLTFDSDFRAFLKPDVDPATQRAALKKLFSDPRFNVMDGLDIYIDDYTKSDPIPPEMLAKLVHGRRLLGLPPEPAPGDPGGAAPDGPSTAATVATAEPDGPVPATAPDAAASNPVGEPAANNAPDEPAPR